MKNSHVPVAKKLLQKVGTVSPFSGSQFPYPLNQSLFGELNMEALHRSAENSHGSRLEEQLPVLLALAELVEASQPDKEEFFITDTELRARLVQLNRTDGWALLWGEQRRSGRLSWHLYSIRSTFKSIPCYLTTIMLFHP